MRAAILTNRAMTLTITRQIAERAVDAWMRRLLPSPDSSHRPDGMISAFDKEVTQLRMQTCDALIQAVVDTRLDAKVCKNPDRGRQLLSHSIQEGSSSLAERVRTLERTVGRNPPLWRRYLPLITAIRALDDPESDATVGLLHEICFVLTLSGRKSLPWARRR